MIDFKKVNVKEVTVFSWNKYFESENSVELLLAFFLCSLMMVAVSFQSSTNPFISGMIFFFLILVTVCFAGLIGINGTMTKYVLVKKE